MFNAPGELPTNSVPPVTLSAPVNVPPLPQRKPDGAVNACPPGTVTEPPVTETAAPGLAPWLKVDAPPVCTNPRPLKLTAWKPTVPPVTLRSAVPSANGPVNDCVPPLKAMLLPLSVVVPVYVAVVGLRLMPPVPLCVMARPVALSVPPLTDSEPVPVFCNVPLRLNTPLESELYIDVLLLPL